MGALWPSPAQLEVSMTARSSIEREINIVLGKNVVLFYLIGTAS
jgi:hypothetical protein